MLLARAKASIAEKFMGFFVRYLYQTSPVNLLRCPFPMGGAISLSAAQ